MEDPGMLKIDPRTAWEPYRPGPDDPWNVERVGHLYRRAAFGATAGELEACLRDGPAKTLERLLSGGPGQEAFDASTAPLGESTAKGNNGQQLSAWWVYRMLGSPHPLREKLTLFWHNHFATSNAKVQSARFMLGQYELMYRHALGNFGVLLREMSKDPAMMVWLDTRASKKGNPNENYARELMELFSLGIDHYTEKDIREAARAFTGWDVKASKAVFSEKEHDPGAKTVLGKTGAFTGDDIVGICLEQPAAAPFIVTKLYRFLVSETVPPTPELIEPLAAQFRASGWDVGALVRTVLSSRLFFSPAVYRTRVKSPIEFALGIVRGLEGRVGAAPLAVALEELGQHLFYPPSVKGWDGGRAWLNGQTFLVRQNLALALTSTEDGRFGGRADPAALARRLGKPTDEQLLGQFLRLFLQGGVPPASRQRLDDYLARSRGQAVPVFWTAQDAEDHRVRTLCYLVLTLPEFQLS
jgi:uncharacterized protein (DUF1800 family)